MINKIKQDKVGIGIIGMGGIAGQHLEALKHLSDEAEIVSVMDIDVKKAQKLLDEKQIQTKVVSEISSVLNDPKVRLVHVCLPNSMHTSVSIKAMESGKTVLCEKPLACSLAEIDAILEAEERTGESVFSVFQLRYGLGFKTLKKLVEKGYTGKLLSASGYVNWFRSNEYYNNGWRGTWTGEKGGCVLTCGIHALDLLLEILGKPVTLYAQAAHRGHEIETEDIAQILGRFENNNAMGIFQVTTNTPEDSTCLKFCFEKMTVISSTAQYFFANPPWKFLAVEKEQQSKLDKVVKELGYAESEEEIPGELSHFEQIADVVRYVREGGQLPEVPAEKTRKVIEFITKMYQSVQNSAVIENDVSRSDSFYSEMRGSLELTA